MKTEPTRISRMPHIALDTPIGTRMAIRSTGAERRLWSVFVGMEKNRYVLLRQNKKLDPIVSPGNRLMAEYIIEHQVFGFSTAVIYTVDLPFPLMFMEYPRTVECMNLRQHERAICFLPVTIYWQGEEYPGHILDISSGGCRLAVSPAGADQLSGLTENASLFCCVSLNGVELYLHCSTRSLTRNHGGLFVGIKFLDLSEKNDMLLADYSRKINVLRT